jgi:hypothetical protein
LELLAEAGLSIQKLGPTIALIVVSLPIGR